MTFQILNGDALTDRFRASGIPGEIVVVRECLIEGTLEGDPLADFWQNRADYIFGTYHADPEMYFKDVVAEFNRLLAAPNNSEFNLWFGYDLFCRANMWFVMHLLYSLSITKKVFIVNPSFLAPADIWQDFGTAGAEDFEIAFKNRVSCSDSDLKLGDDLWKSYKNNDLKKLETLSKTESISFPYLSEVCKAHIDRFSDETGGPKRVLKEIISDTGTDFYAVFSEFSKRAGVYGFGDLQVKRIYDELVINS